MRTAVAETVSAHRLGLAFGHVNRYLVVFPGASRAARFLMYAVFAFFEFSTASSAVRPCETHSGIEGTLTM